MFVCDFLWRLEIHSFIVRAQPCHAVLCCAVLCCTAPCNQVLLRFNRYSKSYKCLYTDAWLTFCCSNSARFLKKCRYSLTFSVLGASFHFVLFSLLFFQFFLILQRCCMLAFISLHKNKFQMRVKTWFRSVCVCVWVRARSNEYVFVRPYCMRYRGVGVMAAYGRNCDQNIGCCCCCSNLSHHCFHF